MLKVYSDAAVNGPAGQAGVGVVITGSDRYDQLTIPLAGQWDNHSAEFEGIVQAMSYLIQEDLEDHMIFIYSDSRAVVDLLHKGYSKNKNFQPYLDRIYLLEERFTYISIDWLASAQNRGADQLARQALQQARQNQSS